MNNRVNPIYKMSDIKKVFEYLENRNERNYMIFLLGINTGLRISDLRKLTIFDINTSNEKILRIKVKKTGKILRIPVLEHVKQELSKYLKTVRREKKTFLFTPLKSNKPLSTNYIYKVMKEIECKFNLHCLGTHTLRKTFAYHFYKNTKDLATLMNILGHESETYTLLYIGITQNTIDKQMKKWGGIKNVKSRCEDG